VNVDIDCKLVVKLQIMKKLQWALTKAIFSLSIVFAANFSFSQTSRDTIKAGHANDSMNVNPGKVDNRMAVKPANPYNSMAILSDTAFLTKSIMDNRMEIQLSKLGQTKGSSTMVKKVAALMVADHTTILNDLTKLALQKKVAVQEHGNDMTGPEINVASGPAFDQEWAGKMLAMHEAKIVELESFLSLVKDPALKAAVLRAIPKIKSHRDLLLKIPGAKEKSKITHTV
jgi:predicted outer membrane protein